MKIEVNGLPLVRIDDDEIFKIPEFIEWLNDTDRNQATWHVKGEDPGEYSDCFMYYASEHPGDCSDGDMPEAAWDRLVACMRMGGVSDTECIVWLTNLGMSDMDDLAEADQRPMHERGPCLVCGP
jgi:hypothetical protein